MADPVFFLGLLLGIMLGLLIERYVLEPLATQWTRGRRA